MIYYLIFSRMITDTSFSPLRTLFERLTVFFQYNAQLVTLP